MSTRLEVRVNALSRRLAALEALLHGDAQERLTPDSAMLLYYEVHRAMGRGKLTEVGVKKWAAAFLALDEEVVLELARRTGDPFPWRPFFRLGLALVKLDDDVRIRGAVLHLQDVAKNVLDAQGLELLEPEDVMHTPTTLEAMTFQAS